MIESGKNKENARALFKELIVDITVIMKNHRKLWLARNRVGGLDDSARKLDKLYEQYIRMLMEEGD